MKLSDGKGLKGAGRLTNKIIDQIQGYYGRAIRSNQPNLDRMSWAIWYHKASTDDRTEHGLCHSPPDTWCTYHKTQGSGILGSYKYTFRTSCYYGYNPTLFLKTYPVPVSLESVSMERHKTSTRRSSTCCGLGSHNMLD